MGSILSPPYCSFQGVPIRVLSSAYSFQGLPIRVLSSAYSFQGVLISHSIEHCWLSYRLRCPDPPACRAMTCSDKMESVSSSGLSNRMKTCCSGKSERVLNVYVVLWTRELWRTKGKERGIGKEEARRMEERREEKREWVRERERGGGRREGVREWGREEGRKGYRKGKEKWERRED